MHFPKKQNVFGIPETFFTEDNLIQNIRKRMTRQSQMSEALILSLFLAFSGGYQDAYTYMVRDHVFANAQTGNVVLMSTLFMQRQWLDALRYLFPLLAFMLGILLSDGVRLLLRSNRLHWRQGVLLVETAIMVLVGFLPHTWNMAANVLVSFSCAMQVQSFRTVCGNPYASTMCIGNLRSGVAAFSEYLRTRERPFLRRAACYFGVILSFAVGAGLGGVLSGRFGIRTIWLSPAVLLLCGLLMQLDKRPQSMENIKK